MACIEARGLRKQFGTTIALDGIEIPFLKRVARFRRHKHFAGHSDGAAQIFLHNRLFPGQRFVQAYQRVQPLTIGELWAVTITLRVVLVENLRRIADAIVRGRAARQEADALADELLGEGGQAVRSVAAVMSR